MFLKYFGSRSDFRKIQNSRIKNILVVLFGRRFFRGAVGRSRRSVWYMKIVSWDFWSSVLLDFRPSWKIISINSIIMADSIIGVVVTEPDPLDDLCLVWVEKDTEVCEEYAKRNNKSFFSDPNWTVQFTRCIVKWSRNMPRVSSIWVNFYPFHVRHREQRCRAASAHVWDNGAKWRWMERMQRWAHFSCFGARFFLSICSGNVAWYSVWWDAGSFARRCIMVSDFSLSTGGGPKIGIANHSTKYRLQLFRRANVRQGNTKDEFRGIAHRRH